MAKTLFEAFGMVVTSAFLNSIFGQGANGGHKHDGADADGHCAKISASEVEKEVLETITNTATARAITSAFPLGSIQMYAGSTAPFGYLLCDGAAVPADSIYDGFRRWIDDNADYLKIDNAYRTPDLRGRVAVGAGMKIEDGQEYDFKLKDTGGEYKHKLNVEEMPSHNHYVGGADSGAAGNGGYLSGQNTNRGSSATGGDKSHNNIQPYAVVNYIIRGVN